MNKRQLIVIWATGIAICATILLYPKKYFISYGEQGQRFFDMPHPKALPVIQWAYVVPICLSILIISALLIYTLKDNPEIKLVPKIKKGIEYLLTIKVKKIIAKQLLILLGFLIIGGITFCIGYLDLKHCKVKILQEAAATDNEYKQMAYEEQQKANKMVMNPWLPLGTGFTRDAHNAYYIQLIGFWLFCIGYPLYLIIIELPIWAVRTLKQRK